MRNTRFAAGVMALALAMGCSREEVPAASPLKPMPIILLKYPEYPDRTECLENAYGFLISWNESEAPRFYVYDAVRRRIDATGDFAEFLRLLSAFPNDVKVRWVRGCTAGFCWAMPEDKRGELEKLRAAKGFRDAGDEDHAFIVCTCETKEVVFLERAP